MHFFLVPITPRYDLGKVRTAKKVLLKAFIGPLRPCIGLILTLRKLYLCVERELRAEILQEDMYHEYCLWADFQPGRMRIRGDRGGRSGLRRSPAQAPAPGCQEVESGCP